MQLKIAELRPEGQVHRALRECVYFNSFITLLIISQEVQGATCLKLLEPGHLRIVCHLCISELFSVQDAHVIESGLLCGI